MRLTLKTTLIGIVAALVLVIAAQAIMAVSKSQSINEKAEELGGRWLPSVKSLGEIKYMITRARLFEARMVLTTDPEQRRQVESQIATLKEQLRAAPGGDWERLAKMAAEERALAERVDTMMKEWTRLSEEIS